MQKAARNVNNYFRKRYVNKWMGKLMMRFSTVLASLSQECLPSALFPGQLLVCMGHSTFWQKYMNHQGLATWMIIWWLTLFTLLALAELVLSSPSSYHICSFRCSDFSTSYILRYTDDCWKIRKVTHHDCWKFSVSKQQ